MVLCEVWAEAENIADNRICDRREVVTRAEQKFEHGV
jgi:hypothetical protein